MGIDAVKTKIVAVISDYRYLLIAFVVISLGISIQSLLSGPNFHEDVGISYNYYNNYSIFKHSFNHLLDYKDLYILHIEDHFDLYKYSPTFSVFFGLFAVFPDWIGLSLWNIFNSLLLLASVYYLPRLNNYQKGIILLIVLVEMITSIQNAQSNALIAALFIFAFGLLEKQKYALATLSIVFTVFIKIFGIVAFALLLFYPKKWKLLLYSLIWSVVLLLIPLLFIDFEQYTSLLYSYGNMLKTDHSSSYGMSVLGWLYTWFSLIIDKYLIVIMGAIIFMIPMVRIKQFSNFYFKLLALSSILIWVVIFNHKAESPTFIIAMAGVAIWYVISEKSTINNILFWFAFIFTSMSPTDLFPAIIRDEFVVPYVLKGVPCIFIWIKIIYEMIVINSNNSSPEKNKEPIDVGTQ